MSGQQKHGKSAISPLSVIGIIIETVTAATLFIGVFGGH